MRLCTYINNTSTQAGIIMDNQLLPLPENDVKQVIEKYTLTRLMKFVKDFPGDYIDLHRVEVTSPYLNPPKIWGIGLNYSDHAEDLAVESPRDEPASFMKPATSITPPGGPIILPLQSNKVTGEGELGIIIGKRCKNVSVTDASKVIFGYTTIIDVTAEDILKRNPRYLTMSKSFDTFFCFGPDIVTSNMINDLDSIVVRTVLNDSVIVENLVENMTFRPMELVSFHSKIMTLEPGDIISTGTPGALRISSGDVIKCQVDNIGSVSSKVIDFR